MKVASFYLRQTGSPFGRHSLLFGAKVLASAPVTRLDQRILKRLQTPGDQREICLILLIIEQNVSHFPIYDAQWRWVRISAVHSEHVKQQYLANGLNVHPCGFFHYWRESVWSHSQSSQLITWGRAADWGCSSTVTQLPVPNGGCWFYWLEIGSLKQNGVEVSHWQRYRDGVWWQTWPLVYSDMADVTYGENWGTQQRVGRAKERKFLLCADINGHLL